MSDFHSDCVKLSMLYSAAHKLISVLAAKDAKDRIRFAADDLERAIMDATPLVRRHASLNLDSKRQVAKVKAGLKT